MEWDNLRGTALTKPQKTKLDTKKLEYRIHYIVREELKDYIDFVKITRDNQYGNWNII